MASSEGMTSSTCSFAYSYQLVKKCFLKICETSKCHNFLIFQPIFIRFSLFCSNFFTLSSEIKLEQLWTSPLIRAGICPSQKGLLIRKWHKVRLLEYLLHYFEGFEGPFIRKLKFHQSAKVPLSEKERGSSFRRFFIRQLKGIH